MKTITEYLINNHVKNVTNYVDLGLPSDTLWATMNIGATEGKKPEDWHGLYFAWGETKGYKATDKHDFSWDTYKFGTEDKLTKYNKKDNLKQLEDKDDAVYQNTNGKCRLPTTEEIRELYKYTENIWVDDYNEINGLNGRLFTGYNGNTLFIPASGDSINNYYDFGNYFFLWSSDLDSNTNCANRLSSNKDNLYVWHGERCSGFAVRGVLNK